jgi:hypothetical protein
MQAPANSNLRIHFSLQVNFAGGKDVGKYSSNLAAAPDAYIILKLAVSVELENEMRARIRSELRRSLGGADGTHITPEAAAAAGAAAPAFHCEYSCRPVSSDHC